VSHRRRYTAAAYEMVSVSSCSHIEFMCISCLVKKENFYSPLVGCELKNSRALYDFVFNKNQGL
jgi:hypothetical protein